MCHSAPQFEKSEPKTLCSSFFPKVPLPISEDIKSLKNINETTLKQWKEDHLTYNCVEENRCDDDRNKNNINLFEAEIGRGEYNVENLKLIQHHQEKGTCLIFHITHNYILYLEASCQNDVGKRDFFSILFQWFLSSNNNYCED